MGKRNRNKSKGKDVPSNDGNSTGPVTNDPRFSKLNSDPRFIRPKVQANKVKVDQRFKGIFEESMDFKSNTKVDKYGRKNRQTVKEDLSRFYQFEDEKKENSGSEDEENSGSENELEELDEAKVELVAEASSEEEQEIDENDPETRKNLVFARSRGEALLGSDSEDEASTEEEYDEHVEEEEVHEDVPRGDETKRFVCMNMDWDHIKSKDLFKVFNSFKPEKGIIRSVSIYPSEFGRERMEDEAINGPPKEIFEKEDSGSDLESDSEDEGSTLFDEDEGEEFNQAKLRKYQLDRLKYFYAVVECDSVATAKKIYDNCDGDEYESTANFFDLRFIPDEMSFVDEPRDSCQEDDVNYKSADFITSALTNSKVSLTWEQDDPERLQITSKKFTPKEIDDMNFDAFLGSDSESETEASALRQKYLSLIKDGDNDEGSDQDMQITFTAGLSEKKGLADSEESEGDSEDEEEGELGFDGETAEPTVAETSVEKYLRKQREKLQAKKAAKLEKYEQKKALSVKPTKAELRAEQDRAKAELELVMLDDGDVDQREHFDIKQVMKAEKLAAKKGKIRKNQKPDTELVQDSFKIDAVDPRFQAIHESHHFAIDPTHPQFKKTKAMQEILHERQRRIPIESEEPSQSNQAQKEPVEQDNNKGIDQLVNMVKRKSDALQAKLKGNLGKRRK